MLVNPNQIRYAVVPAGGKEGVDEGEEDEEEDELEGGGGDDIEATPARRSGLRQPSTSRSATEISLITESSGTTSSGSEALRLRNICVVAHYHGRGGEPRFGFNVEAATMNADVAAVLTKSMECCGQHQEEVPPDVYKQQSFEYNATHPYEPHGTVIVSSRSPVQ